MINDYTFRTIGECRLETNLVYCKYFFGWVHSVMEVMLIMAVGRHTLWLSRKLFVNNDSFGFVELELWLSEWLKIIWPTHL